MPSTLDQELEKAIQTLPEPDIDGATRTPAPQPGSPRRLEAEPVTLGPRHGSGAKKGNVGLLAVLLLMAGAILVLVMTSFKNAAVYAKHVDEVVAARSELIGRKLRVEGLLVHGSLERRDQPCEYRFLMERNGQTLLVRYPQCVVPDTFRDVPGVEVGVTVEGKLAASGDFVATQVMAKCPSKYQERGASSARDPSSVLPRPSYE